MTRKLSEQRERALAKAIKAVLEPDHGAVLVMFPRSPEAKISATPVSFIAAQDNGERPTTGEFMTALSQALSQFIDGEITSDMEPQAIADRAMSLGAIASLQLNRELNAAGRPYAAPQAMVISALAGSLLSVAPASLVAEFLEQLAAGVQNGSGSADYQRAWEALENSAVDFVNAAASAHSSGLSKPRGSA